MEFMRVLAHMGLALCVFLGAQLAVAQSDEVETLVVRVGAGDVGSGALSNSRRFREATVPLFSGLSLNWRFLSPVGSGQPYVGLGYIDFGSERLNRQVRQLLLESGGAGRVKMGFGYPPGLRARVGVDFRFAPDSAWVGKAAVMYLDVGGDGVVRPMEVFGVPGGQHGDDFNYDPWIFNLGVGYTFSF